MTANKKGFTLLEAMLAVLIMGISITALLSLQGTLMRRTFSAHALFERVIAMRNYLTEADKSKFYNDQKKHEKKLEYPLTTITYVSKKDIQALKKFPNMVLENVEAKWSGLTSKSNVIDLIALKFVPKVEKS